MNKPILVAFFGMFIMLFAGLAPNLDLRIVIMLVGMGVSCVIIAAKKQHEEILAKLIHSNVSEK